MGGGGRGRGAAEDGGVGEGKEILRPVPSGENDGRTSEANAGGPEKGWTVVEGEETVEAGRGGGGRSEMARRKEGRAESENEREERRRCAEGRFGGSPLEVPGVESLLIGGGQTGAENPRE